MNQTIFQRNSRLVPQFTPNLADIGEAVANITSAVAARDFRLDVFLTQDAGDALRNFYDRVLISAAHVEDLSDSFASFQRQPACLYDVVDVDEVPDLIAVFKDHRRLLVQQARCEDRKHPPVGIRQRLPRAIDVEEAKSDGGYLIYHVEHKNHDYVLVF